MLNVRYTLKCLISKFLILYKHICSKYRNYEKKKIESHLLHFSYINISLKNTSKIFKIKYQSLNLKPNNYKSTFEPLFF